MEKEEIERRLAALEERTAELEAESETLAVSSPSPGLLLGRVETLIEQLSSDIPPGPAREGLLARLQKLLSKARATIAAIQTEQQIAHDEEKAALIENAASKQAEADRERARQRALQEEEDRENSFGMRP
ncbi:MAG: hypothetical protein ABN502_12980 [Gammaproteobacteria bacterium]